MAKIGIITILNVNNYGAELQAFALHHRLKLMGYDNEIINYLYYKNPRYIKEPLSAPLIKTSVKNSLKDLVLKWIDKYSAFRHPAIAKIRQSRFEEFHAKNTALSKVYASYSSLYNTKMDYDTYIVGSDQVWNPNNGTNLDPYFLTFAPKTAKRISYASSFGVSTIPAAYHKKYKQWLENIQFLATREADGVRAIKVITGRDATHVVDPTLLLTKEEWQELMVPYKSNDPYILVFLFQNSTYVTDLAYAIQKKTGYKIIRICKNELSVESDDKILNIRDFGPAEFLGLYSSSSIVLTTSFHGTIFSLIFEKPFFTITPKNKNNNSRQESLLNMVNLPNRLIKEGDVVSLEDLELVDFAGVTEKIEYQRTKSVEFLNNSLLA